MTLRVTRIHTRCCASTTNRVDMCQIQNTGNLTLRADFQIVIPPTLVPGLIDALQKQLATHEINFSKEILKSKGGKDAK